MSQGLFLVCWLIWGMQGRACRKESVGQGMGAELSMVVVRKSRVQIHEMKSAEMSKSYRRVPANARHLQKRSVALIIP